ncbi:MAG: GNAT family protein [Candidatus Dormiibacterota bacterium]|jgi:RimJ/RimL family protein N-acetyltransferase
MADQVADHDPTTGLPVGRLVDASPAPFPTRVTISGSSVQLVPLDRSLHADALWEGLRGPANDRLWRYLLDGPYVDRASFDLAMDWRARSEDQVFFAILDGASSRALGCAALMRIDPPNRSIEVGNILYTPQLQRTRAATEAMYLLARHIFEGLGYRRYEWKCDSLNAPSRQAALRLGFTYEGTFRQHMINKGRNRDTAWFSILDLEWPARKARLERWLDPSNFGPQGQQKMALSELEVGGDAPPD